MVAGVALRSSGALALCAPAARTLARASHTSLGLARPSGPLPTCGCGASFGKVPARLPKSSWYVPGAAVANKECIPACGKLVRVRLINHWSAVTSVDAAFQPAKCLDTDVAAWCGCFLPLRGKVMPILT